VAEYRLVIDQSTSGTKVILFDTESNIEMLQRVDKPHTQLYPQKGWVEHDPEEIVANVKDLIGQILIERNLEPRQIASLSITNQRESVVIWDRETGKAYTNVLVWQCNRGIDICQKLNQRGYGSVVREKTGLNIDPYFSGSKLKWFFDQAELTDGQLNNLAIGTIDTWLVWNLSKEKNHLTEVSNASRTLLFNIHTLEWDEALCDIFNVPIASLPSVKDSVDDFGTYQGIPIISIVADSQSALIGNGCLEKEDVKATLGTGSSVLVNIGKQVLDNNGTILTTIVSGKNGETTYALEGVIRSYGDILNWQKDQLGFFANFEEASKNAFSVLDNGGVYLIPALEGMGAPFWAPDVHAEFVGMSRYNSKSHLIRAGFEAMVYQTRIILDTIDEEFGLQIKRINVDGGLVNNEKFIQLLADVTGREVVIGRIEEASALGTLTLIKNDVASYTEKTFKPKTSYDGSYSTWKEYVLKSISKY